MFHISSKDKFVSDQFCVIPVALVRALPNNFIALEKRRGLLF